MEMKYTQSPQYDDHYLELYGHATVHQHMIRDTVRTKTYYNAICHNRHLFKGKVVMDVGCGTGILSLFAAKAGACRVIAIESSAIADSAKQIMVDNKKDHIVTVVKGRLEDISELPDGIVKVDIIISEFMGYCLFWESMTESVIFARDKWLKPGGLIFPDKCCLYLVGVWDPAGKAYFIDYWKNFIVRGTGIRSEKINPLHPENKNLDLKDMNFDFTDMRKTLIKRPLILSVGPLQVGTDAALLTTLDMNTATVAQLRSMVLPFDVKATCIGTLHSLVTYFTVHFTQCFKMEQFTTQPGAIPTHWKQTLFYFDGQVNIRKGERLRGNFIMEKNKSYERDIDITITVKREGKGWGPENKSFKEENTYQSHHF